jgi:hypothetical protein
MRQAVFIVLNALINEDEEVSSWRSEENFRITRITNEISYIRNKLDIEIVTEMVRKPNARPYGKYHLKRSENNLEKVSKYISTHIIKKPLKMADR